MAAFFLVLRLPGEGLRYAIKQEGEERMRIFFGCLCIFTIIAFPAYGDQTASEAPSDNDPQINMGVMISYWTLFGLKGSSSPAIVKEFYRHDSSKTCMPTQVGSFVFDYHKK